MAQNPNRISPPEHTQPSHKQMMQNHPRSRSIAEKPLTFWDELRAGSLQDDVRRGNNSAVSAVDGIRLAHILSIMPYSEIRSDSSRVASDFRIYIEAAGFLAMHHFNQRSGEVLPHLPQRLQGCNVYFTMDLHDSLLSPFVASRELYKTFLRPGTLHAPLPTALVGAARSAVSQPLSILSGAYNVPHMSGLSTSSAMDNKDISPTFMRTVPTNAVDARATVEYFRSLGVYRFGVLFTHDAYGSQFSRNLQNAAMAYDMNVVSVSYEDNDVASIRDAVQMLKESQLKYFFGVFSIEASVIKTILREASDAGIIGNADHVWLLSESSLALTEPGFYQNLIQSDDPDDVLKVANAISGTGVVLIDIPSNAALDQALSEMGTDSDLLDYYISKHGYPGIFENFAFSPTPSLYQRLHYDAVMAIGIALCDAEQEFITSEELVDQVKETQFEGASGQVVFDAITGTRSPESVATKLVNLVVDVREEGIHLNASRTMSLVLDTNEVHVTQPFVYGGGSMQSSALGLLDPCRP